MISYDIADVGAVLAETISSITNKTCSFTSVSSWSGIDSESLILQPVAVRRNKIDREGVKIDFAFELSYSNPSPAELIDDTLFTEIENYFFHSPTLSGELQEEQKEINAHFLKLVYTSETNIQNGGVLEGYYSTEKLDQNAEEIKSALIYFTGLYNVKEVE